MGNDPRNLEIEEVLVLFDDNDFEKIKRECFTPFLLAGEGMYLT